MTDIDTRLAERWRDAACTGDSCAHIIDAHTSSTSGTDYFCKVYVEPLSIGASMRRCQHISISAPAAKPGWHIHAGPVARLWLRITASIQRRLFIKSHECRPRGHVRKRIQPREKGFDLLITDRWLCTQSN